MKQTRVDELLQALDSSRDADDEYAGAAHDHFNKIKDDIEHKLDLYEQIKSIVYSNEMYKSAKIIQLIEGGYDEKTNK